MLNMANIKEKKATRKLSHKVVAMLAIISITMSSFSNILQATIYTNLPISEVRYNAADNTTVFPESYKAYISAMKIKHPNWIFKAVYTGLDWTESIRQESYEVKTGISLVPDSYSSAWKKDGINNYEDGNFVIASKKAVAYTMDPRNYLNDSGIFQFEALDYNEGTSETSVIDKVILGTTMSSYPTQYKRVGTMTTFDSGLTWSQIIKDAAKNAGGSGVSAVFLASRMKQETSLEILNNGSINGSSTTYPEIYNFFNIGATPNSDGTGSVTNGLIYATSKGWDTPQKSINAGATMLWSSYIRWGQNTTYFQKFDVTNPYGTALWLYGSQYMTNILAPSSEARTTYNAYLNGGVVDSAFTFYIPVYNNMPDAVSAHPDSETTYEDISGTDLIYLDNDVIDGTDSFNIRSGAGSDYNIIAQAIERLEGGENRTKYTRTQVGTNGWDKIRLGDGREGYISQAYVREYVYTHISGITLNKATTNLKVGQNETLTATIDPTNAYIKKVTWSSSNNSIVTVDSAGKITATGVGAVTISATTLDGNKVATCTVTVEKTLAESITTSIEYPLLVGNYLQVNPEVLPATTTDKTYDIAIADTTIAVVEGTRIKGLKIGETKVTLTTKDGSAKSFEFTLKVAETVATISNLTVDSAGIITKIAIGTNASAIKGNISTAYSIKLINSAGTELGDADSVGTGTKVQILSSGNVLQEYTIIIYGDVNGDAKASASDYVLIKNYIMISKTTLNSIQELGADYNNDGKVSASDYVLIKNYIMGK